MLLLAIGINHKTAPLHIREKLTFKQEIRDGIVQDIIREKIAKEAVLISTCNRTELYLQTNSFYSILRWFKKKWSKQINDWASYSYTFSGKFAVRHLMRVASGLDSMVLGEAEILGQLKTAYHVSEKLGGIGKYLGKLFQSTFFVAKKVRTDTRIGISSVSVAYIAVKLSESIFSNIQTAEVLVVGAGNTARLIIKNLISAGVKKILIANRTVSRAKQLACEIDKEFNWHFLSIEMIPDYLFHSDIVITSTASPLPIFGKGMVERVIKLRKYKPIFMVDIAVPRDIEPEVGMLPDVYLYCIDDLHTMAKENQQFRKKAIRQAEVIIEMETYVFLKWMQSQDYINIVCEFREQFYKLRDQCIENSIKQLNSGVYPEEIIRRLAHNMTNKFLHEPTVQMRKASFEGDVTFLVYARKIFRLLDH